MFIIIARLVTKGALDGAGVKKRSQSSWLPALSASCLQLDIRSRALVIFCWDISVISHIIVLKFDVTAFTALYLRKLWPKWVNFLKSYEKIRSMTGKWPPKKPRPLFFHSFSNAPYTHYPVHWIFRVFILIAGYADSWEHFGCLLIFHASWRAWVHSLWSAWANTSK